MSSLCSGKAESYSITVVVAEGQRLVRAGLSLLLSQNPLYKVVGEAADGLEAVNLVERHSPTVLVLDLDLPRLSGFEVITRVASRCRILILSSRVDEASISEAIRRGATSYILRHEDPEDFLQAVQRTSVNRRYISHPVLDLALSALAADAKMESHDPYESLTMREKEVFLLAAEGLTCEAIAKCLFISTRTAETHRARLMTKLRLHSQTELLRFAIRKGLLSP